MVRNNIIKVISAIASRMLALTFFSVLASLLRYTLLGGHGMPPFLEIIQLSSNLSTTAIDMRVAVVYLFRHSFTELSYH